MTRARQLYDFKVIQTTLHSSQKLENMFIINNNNIYKL